MFKKILVPLDGSSLAKKILPEVENLAKCHKSSVTFITVGSYREIFEAPPDVINEALAQEKVSGEKYLAHIVAEEKKKGLAADYVYKEGMPALEIIAYAANNNIDLIAMATHGKGEVVWVLGSVAEKVVSHATVPVLLYRVLEAKQPRLKEEYFMGA